MDANRRIADAIRDYLARERISREQFAAQTRLGKSTIDKLLIGRFSLRTLSAVEGQTNLPLRLMLKERQDPRAAEPPKPQDRPSIAVLPFADLGAERGQDFVADGITEDIITALTRLRWLFVIARNSSFAYKDRSVDVRQAARELGVRYILEGSVRSAGERIRITAQLIDADTGKHIWAEKYDRERRDIFAIQDEITEHVVAAVEPHLYAEEGFRASARPPESLGAWELVVRALALLRHVARRSNEEAQVLLRRAVAMEPGYARAHALLSWALWWSAHCYWAADTADADRQATEHARDALALDPNDPWARMAYGQCLSRAGQHAQAVGELRAALQLNPSFALGRMAFGWVLVRAGQFNAAVAETETALRLSPVDSFSGFYTSIHGLALLALRRFTGALPFLQQAVAEFMEYPGHYNHLICCCGHLGLLNDARDFMQARERIGPPLRLSSMRVNMRNYAHKDVYLEGLAKAGVPE